MARHRKALPSVIPAKAGIQFLELGPRLRGDDKYRIKKHL